MRRLLAGAVLAVVVAGCGTAPPAGNEVIDVVDAVVDSGAVPLRIRVVGPAEAARTAVVVHGGPGLSADAMSAYDALAVEGRRVVGWDQRGSGDSGHPADGDVAIDAHVADLEAIRRAVGAEVIDVIGQSWGGAIAAAYAATHPDRVSTLTLVGAVPLDVGAFIEGQERFRAHTAEAQRAGAVPDPLPRPVEDSCRATFEALLPVYLHDDGRREDVDLGSCTASASTATYEAFVTDTGIARLAQDLGGYRGPALVIVGRHDAFGPGWLDRNLELLAASELRQLVVDGAGHLVVAEAGAQVLAEIASHLQD